MTAGRLTLVQEQISGCSISYLMASMLLLLPQREFKRVTPFRGIRPPFHTQWAEPQKFLPSYASLLSPSSTLRSWLQLAISEIQELGCKTATHRLLLNSHSNRSTEVERGKEAPFFSSAPKDYAGYTIYRADFFCGLGQRGNLVPRQRQHSAGSHEHWAVHGLEQVSPSCSSVA